MTRCEIRLFVEEEAKERIASFYNNSGSYPEEILPVLDCALKECHEEEHLKWAPFYQCCAYAFDCDPVANISYIYEVFMRTGKVKVYRTRYVNRNGGIWGKGQLVKEYIAIK